MNSIDSPLRGAAREVFFAFLRLGLTSFGGPVAHLGYFRDDLVARRKWLSEQHYAELVALSQFLPGPASSQVGFGIGLMRAGMRGALAAWLAFTLPSAVLMVLFAYGAVSLGGVVGQGALVGLKSVAVAVVAWAVIGMARTLTPDLPRIVIAVVAAALALLVAGSIGQISAIVVGGIAGAALLKHQSVNAVEPFTVNVSRRAGIIALSAFVAVLALLPVLAAFTHNTWISIADAFSRAGALVFGGGHVVLPMMQNESAIASSVSAEQFLAGYGAAQALPGPLFAFASFLGFEMVPGAGAIAAAALALISVFLPGMLLLVGVLPFWNRLHRIVWVRRAVTGANAAVVGILAAALVTPIITTTIVGVVPLIIALGCFALLALTKAPAWLVVVIAAVLGAIAGGIGWVELS